MCKHHSTKQKGVVLVISLIILLLMSLLAITSMNTTVLEEKMAGNYKDRNMAFQAAEAGVRGGEAYLRTTLVLPVFDGSTTGLYLPTTSGLPRWKLNVWTSNSREYIGNLSGVKVAPRYIIEELPPVIEAGSSLEAGVAAESRYYRVTSQAVGAQPAGEPISTLVMLQTTYKR